MKYLVVHAHLYQPPRENPWSERIERQPTALPFHDWNERVSDECYERLGNAGVRGPDGRVVALYNLLGRMSFNIGPTLAAWLETYRPEVLGDARTGDAHARERSGAGSALMQPYGHPIMPLCDRREKRLQLAWGLADFRRHFGHTPEGLWLPETAVDSATLEAAADFGLKFTILSPEQVVRIRPLPGGAWSDVSGGRVPPHRPYRVVLPSRRHFTVFVFDGPLSRGTAFGANLRSGESMLNAFQGAVRGIPEEDGLVLLAADGETFGHHQKQAEEKLAEAMVRARTTGLCQVTHLADVFHRLEPTHEAMLAEPSSWSCPHGVGRWKRDCGCGTVQKPGWNWKWRTPLRHAVSNLRDRIFSLVDRKGTAWFPDPWEAAEAFGEVVVSPPSPRRLENFLDAYAKPQLDQAGRSDAATLLELVRQVLFSATSCGWFFDDIGGIEAVQVMRHAARAAELAHHLFQIDPEPDLIHWLADSQSNLPERGNGADIFAREAATARRLPREILALHAVHLFQASLKGTLSASTASGLYGVHAVEELTPPQLQKHSAGGIEIKGTGRVVHLRTGVAQEAEFRIASDAVTRPLVIEIDGQPIQCRCPEVRERILGLAARRAAALLPAPRRDTFLELAWIGQEARELKVPLASPFREAIAGGARELVTELLTTPSGNPQQAVRQFRTALAAARAAGMTPEDLADLRPEIDRQLAFYAAWALGRAPEPMVDDLVAAIRTVRETVGEAAMRRVRRWLCSRPKGVGTADLLALAQATGMSGDALVPVDTPVQAILEDIADTLA